jgi:hypothetical protein
MGLNQVVKSYKSYSSYTSYFMTPPRFFAGVSEWEK